MFANKSISLITSFNIRSFYSLIFAMERLHPDDFNILGSYAYPIAQAATTIAIWRTCPDILNGLPAKDTSFLEKAEKAIEAEEKRILGAGK